MADTKISALTAAAAAAGANEIPINEAGTTKKLTVQQIADLLFTRINSSSGAAGSYKTLQKLSADSADQTSTTPAAVMTTTGVGAGTWHFRYVLLYQTAATTTGIKVQVNHTGTVGQFVSNFQHPASVATASNGIGATLVQGTAGNVWESRPESAKDTITAINVGVVSANTDVLAVVEGFLVVSVSGSLELKVGTEVNASACRIMADSLLELTKIG